MKQLLAAAIFLTDFVVQPFKELRVLKMRSGEDKGKLMEEAERLQQNLKLQTMKTGHLEDQMNELRSSQRVGV